MMAAPLRSPRNARFQCEMLQRRHLADIPAAVPSPAGVDFPLAEGGQGGFAADFAAALGTIPHRISPKYFYDREGSRLFDLICELPEYYPTRTELDILGGAAGEIARLMEPGAELIEFGAGSLKKAGLLLRAMRTPLRFVPIDISGEHLGASAAVLREALSDVQPQLEIAPHVADYTKPLILPRRAQGNSRARYGFFPGSTIGNFAPDEALAFLRGAADLLRGGALILGTDLIKDPARLHAAYNDRQGVTAAFNLNLLARANRELGSRIDLENFAHYAFYNAPEQRIEMHLMARRPQVVQVHGHRFSLAEGESLHTENSYKFTIQGAHALALEAGFVPGPVWVDRERLFAVHWLQAPALPATRVTGGLRAMAPVHHV